MQNPQNLIWLDLEMTGLDTQNDHILEIATIITDAQLNVLAEGPVIAIYQAEATLEAMSKWCQHFHGKNGLTDRCRGSDYDLARAEAETIEFIKKYVPENTSPMCGNSICQDRRFLAREMPTLERYFHYRNLDVSTVKELVRRWYPEAEYNKASSHQALSDIYDSINELRYYRGSVFK